MQMTNVTLLEDLSNEIFYEIFDYLNAFDVFFAFASLNSRISSILKLIRLHVIIHSTYCHYQIKFLSHHLTFHSDQVISLDINDEILDQKNVVAYLYSRHSFLNLRSCIFWYLHSSLKLENVIKQLEKQNQIVLFHIVQAYNSQYDELCISDAHLISQKILLDTPSTLRSAVLRFDYNHPDLVRSTIIDTKLTYLELVFDGTPDDVSIYSLIPVLRIHRTLRHLRVSIKSLAPEDNTYITAPYIPLIDKDDLPTSPSLKSFDLQLLTGCDTHLLGLILRCMPNLREFSLTWHIGILSPSDLDFFLNGNDWQRMLANHASYLNQFDFHISFLMNEETYDLDWILKSFQCFITQYDGWHMGISRWKTFRYVIPCFASSRRNESREYLEHLLSLIDLSTIRKLTFETDNDLTRSYVVPHILLHCPNVTTLIIDTSLLFLPIVIDNPDLALTFNRINRLTTTADSMSFSFTRALKFVQRFPSLTYLTIHVYSIDSCELTVDILLGGLAKLRLLIVQFYRDSLLDDSCLREYVIEKRRQSFGLKKNDEYKVVVKIEDYKLSIWTA